MSVLKSLWSSLRPPHTERLLWERRWHNETVQVWEKPGRRELRFSNHIVQSALTLAAPDHLALRYPQHMMLALLLGPNPQSALHLGLGAGSLATFLHRSFPKLQQVVIEQNPEVAEAAHHFFNLPQDPRIDVRIADAYEAVPELTESFDLIFLDTFNASGAPEHLQSEAFLSTLRERLTPGGWAVGNAWSMVKSFPEYRRCWVRVFSYSMQVRTQPNYGNVIFFGTLEGPLPKHSELRERASQTRTVAPLNFREMLGRLVVLGENGR
ncbi:MAG TPA: methyltransferase domain-containing protein [Deltaproteobacteria bacterium]|nr:methyltransferase domain-containing protein [Deltaproteobacteria bacterium]